MGAYTDQIDFSGKVIIIFGSNATLDAGQKGRFFYGDASKDKSSLELHDIILKNGNANDLGGAILISNGALKIYDSTFESNTAPDYIGYGGAIHAEIADVKISTSTFESNTAHSYGGAIYITNGTLVIHDSTLNTNNAHVNYGGAIYIRDGNLDIHDSTFDANTARIGGGAIAAYNTTVHIFTSAFESNSAYYDSGGGAIYAGTSANVEIHDTIFTSNTATYRNQEKDGGAIFASSADVKIYTSTFEGNTASGLGGAIFVDGSLAAFNCTFYGNTASAGGAVYVNNGTHATFTGCIFNGNDGTKGHNDITRMDDTSNVTFACANGTVGTPVTMKAGESEIANPPPKSLKCTAQTYACYNGGKANWKCVPDSTSKATPAQCHEVCAP
jgi:predicted outer membrane repeat protein